MSAPIRPPVSTKRPMLDLPTLGVSALMVLGLPATILATHLGYVHPVIAAIVGSLLMNLSFTTWHEASHGNVSKKRWVNTAVGIATSFASVYPGYFARRREHLAHHRFEGDPKQDPVYPRIQANKIDFLPKLVRSNYGGDVVPIPEGFMPLSPAQRWADRASNLGAVALILVCFAAGAGVAITAGWVVPRAVIFIAHAYYICLLPHSVPGGGYTLYRVRPSPALWLLTAGQNLHGIHHRWPAIPWHQYGTVMRKHREQVEAAGIEVV